MQNEYNEGNNKSNINLSSSFSGKSWISQFDNCDRETASTILDSLIYVNNSQLINGLRNLILAFLDSHPSEAIAIFASREVVNGEYFSNENKMPKSIDSNKPVGSEGILSHFCRDMAKSDNRILNHPSLKNIKKFRCRYILCIDDMIGSGNRIVSFAKWMYRNKTLKSWHSLKYIKFIACAYAASECGKKYVEKNKIFDESIFVQAINAGRSVWSVDEKKQIETICKKYSKHTNRPNLSLGYKDAFTFIIFPHSCPNTNPSILWSSKKKSWNAIFSIRPEFDLMEDVIHLKKTKQSAILKELGHKCLQEKTSFHKLSSESRQIIILLSYLGKYQHKDYVLSDLMELPMTLIRRLVADCCNYGWIDSKKRLTKEGKYLLRSARKDINITNYQLEIKSDFYYPKTYRSLARSSSSGLFKGECHES